jgi:diguanylate cyclase (GGDEF)-like protein
MYWDTIGLAVAAAHEQALIESELDRLRRRALQDRLTGLPNGVALDQQLLRYEQRALSVLALDFDGMREANAAFKSYELGGDVLIKLVGQALGRLARTGEFAARLYTAGDEFALLLGDVDQEAACRRAEEVEAQLDALEVPESHRAVYYGASVGCATRHGSETPGQVLGRAIEAMHERKLTRRDARTRTEARDDKTDNDDRLPS